MKVGNATVRFPREDEPHGRRPTIIVCAEGRLGDVLSAVPYVLTFISVALLSWALYQSAAPLWSYSIVLPIIGLGIMKHLETKAYSRASVPVRQHIDS